jgi:hypothetical protein
LREGVSAIRPIKHVNVSSGGGSLTLFRSDAGSPGSSAELIIKRTLHIDGCENLLRWDAAIEQRREIDGEEIDSASLQKFTVTLLEIKSEPRLQISQLDEIDESMRSPQIDFIS